MLAHDRRMQGIQRHVRVPLRPEAVREPQEVGLVDGTQHLGHCALDDLVLQRRHTERPLTAVGFGNVDPPYRLWPVATGVDSFAEITEVIRQPLFVLRHGHPIDPSAGLPLLSSKRPMKSLFVDMMQQGREPGLGSLVGRRVHPLEVWRQGDPALRPDPGLLAQAPLGLAPSLHASRYLRRLHGYYEPVRLPTSARTAALAVPCRCPPLETNPADPVGPLMFR